MATHELKHEHAVLLLEQYGADVTVATLTAVKEAFRIGTQVDVMKIVHEKGE
jgi:hypothetical protein